MIKTIGDKVTIEILKILLKQKYIESKDDKGVYVRDGIGSHKLYEGAKNALFGDSLYTDLIGKIEKRDTNKIKSTKRHPLHDHIKRALAFIRDKDLAYRDEEHKLSDTERNNIAWYILDSNSWFDLETLDNDISINYKINDDNVLSDLMPLMVAYLKFGEFKAEDFFPNLTELMRYASKYYEEHNDNNNVLRDISENISIYNSSNKKSIMQIYTINDEYINYVKPLRIVINDNYTKSLIYAINKEEKEILISDIAYIDEYEEPDTNEEKENTHAPVSASSDLTANNYFKTFDKESYEYINNGVISYEYSRTNYNFTDTLNKVIGYAINVLFVAHKTDTDKKSYIYLNNKKVNTMYITSIYPLNITRNKYDIQMIEYTITKYGKKITRPLSDIIRFTLPHATRQKIPELLNAKKYTTNILYRNMVSISYMKSIKSLYISVVLEVKIIAYDYIKIKPLKNMQVFATQKELSLFKEQHKLHIKDSCFYVTTKDTPDNIETVLLNMINSATCIKCPSEFKKRIYRKSQGCANRHNTNPKMD